ncbi:hypothetical protein [Baaleninema simplex]|nr:hypothetical protein [Baaleninema simplex]
MVRHTGSFDGRVGDRERPRDGVAIAFCCQSFDGIGSGAIAPLRS